MRTLVLFAAVVGVMGCPTLGPPSIPCRTNANCPSGYGCNVDGVCERGAAGSSGARLLLTPAVATVPLGATQRFSALLDGAEAPVTWSVQGGGSISEDGTFTPPDAVPDPDTVTIKAATRDGQVSGTALVVLVSKNPVPALTTVSPAAITVGSVGVTMDLTGSGFVAASRVVIGESSLVPAQVSATALRVSLPDVVLARGGLVAVRVQNPAPGGGSSNPVELTLSEPLPSLSATVTPPSALTGSATVVLALTGTGFTADTAVRLDSTGLKILSWTPTTLNVEASAAQLASARLADLWVENPPPGGGSAKVSFPVMNPAPALATVTPSTVLASSGPVTITVSGAGFRPSSVVHAGATDLITTYVSDTALSVALPSTLSQTPGVIALAVRNAAPGGGDSSPVNLVVGNPVPVGLSLSATSALVGSAAFTLAVDGAAFVPNSVVYWGTTALTTTYSATGPRLSAAVPSSLLQTAGLVSISVVNPPPGGGTGNALMFAVNNRVPTVTTLSPTSALAGSGGVNVTITGTSFLPASVAVLDGVQLATTYTSATSLTAAIPATSLATGRVANLTVENPSPGGGPSTAAAFNVNNPAASLGSLSPSSALGGGAAFTLTVNGAAFVNGAAITFDGQPLSTTWVSASQVRATVPAGLLSSSRVVTVTARNPTPGGGAGNDLVFRVEQGIRTVAGGYTGLGGPARDAVQPRVERMAIHPTTGEIYIAFDAWHQIMKIDTQGRLQRVAGNGLCDFTGDGGPALAAMLCDPYGMDFDAAGNLYFFDWDYRRVRKIDTTGRISTIAGTGECASNGDGGPAITAAVSDVIDLKVSPSGDIYLVSNGGCGGFRVRKISNGNISLVAGTGARGSTGDGADARLATLDEPYAIAVQPVAPSGEQIYVAEFNGHRVRKVNTAGIISTFAGNGDNASYGDGGLATMAAVGRPRGLVLDSSGNLYVSQYWPQRIRKIDGRGIITTIAGIGQDGPVSPDGTAASTARIGHPSGMFFAGGQLHFLSVQDWGSDQNALKKIDGSGNLVTLTGLGSGNPTALQSFFHRPYAQAADAVGNLYICDRENDHIWKVDVAGVVTSFAGTGVRGNGGDGGPAALAQLAGPTSIWFDSAGNAYISEADSWRVRKVDATGIISTVAGGGDWPAGCPDGPPSTRPPGAGTGYNCIGDDYRATAAMLTSPTAVVGDGRGNLYIAEWDISWDAARGNRIRKVNLSTGVITTIAGNPQINVTTCAYAGDGALATTSRLCGVSSLAIDKNGDLLVADGYNRRLRRINLISSPVGYINTFAGNGNCCTGGNGGPAPLATFNFPSGLAADSQGNIYVADSNSPLIRRIDSTNVIYPVAGLDAYGFSGDGGRASDALFNGPRGLALSADGKLLYVADTNNNRVRVIGP